MMTLKNRHKQKGASSLLVVIGLLAAVMFAFVAVIGRTHSLDQRIRTARMRAQMTALESRWRSLLIQPAAYSCNYDSSGKISCGINYPFLAKYRDVKIRGLGCGASSPCTLSVKDDPTFDNNTRIARFKIEAVGTAIGLEAKTIPLQVPDDVLHANAMDCTSAAGAPGPVFRGFTANGQIDCRALNANCPADQFVTGINPANGDVQCTNDPTDVMACAPSEFMSNFEWHGGIGVTKTCVPRENPFAGMNQSGTVTGTQPRGYSKVPIYRGARIFVDASHPTGGLDHLFTLFPDEITYLGYNPENIGFYLIYENNIPGTHPVTRCVWGKSPHHHYVSLSPSATCETTTPTSVGEGILGYAFDAPQPGTVPLYRFYNNSNSDHLTTLDVNGEGAIGYVLENSLGYVPQ